MQTIYGVEDLWDLIEMHAAHCHNLANARGD
ncbi:hypothetical protein BDI4_210042 [Burkholderia diffusa]|nr:hypothetical protein BDI4_210042 [Burkholderia diffusa]